VDDDDATRSLLRAIVEDSAAPCRVYEAADSETALRIARNIPVDLVLLDIVLPNSALSGVMVCQELCKDQRTRVVIVSGSTSKAILDACLSAGALECITKPFALGEIRPRLQGWLC
jgi:DNA-binding response OmpR family regulator